MMLFIFLPIYLSTYIVQHGKTLHNMHIHSFSDLSSPQTVIYRHLAGWKHDFSMREPKMAL